MKRLSMTCIVLAVVGSAWAQITSQAARLSPADISDLFSQGKRLFAEANELRIDDPDAAYKLYEQSLLYYERIVADGEVRNGKLYYNIGNIQIRLGDVGRAILSYHRASNYIPNDPNLLQNLEYARSIRLDNVDQNERAAIVRILFFWHFDLSPSFKLVVFSACFALIWIFAGLRSLLRRRGFTWGTVVFSVIAVLLIASLSWETVEIQNSPAGVILVTEVTGRKGNSDTYQPSFSEPLHAGTEFVLREDRGDWLLVELDDGRRTWLPSHSVGLVTEAL